MKNLIPFLLIFSLGCTETEYIEIEKIIYKDKQKDSVLVNLTGKDLSDKIQFTGKTFVGLDTTSAHVCVDGKDTVFVVMIDSVFIYVPVPGETVFKIIETFRDTFPYFPGRTVYFVPTEVQPIVNEFYAQCQARGLIVTGGSLFVTLWTEDEAPPENRSSMSFNVWTNGQWVIKVKDNIPYEYWYTPLFRELAREQLKKPYDKDPESIMNPAFDPYVIGYSSSVEEKLHYLDKLFEQ